MRKVIYMTELNDYRAKSLRELRTHVAFFNRPNKCNDYDGDFVHRFVKRAGIWVCDDDFFVQINIVNGRVLFRRIKVHSIPGIGIPVNAKP